MVSGQIISRLARLIGSEARVGLGFKYIKCPLSNFRTSLSSQGWVARSGTTYEASYAVGR